MEWKDIIGFEGKYQVSDTGKVRSLWRYKPSGRGKYTTREDSIQELKSIDSNGYKIVILMENGKRNRRYIHRLVAEAFIPNPESKPNVNHRDFNPSNNSVNNLEWCTQKENVDYSICNFPKRKNCKTNCGEPHIHKTKYETFLVRLGNPTRTFKTLDEAIIYRDCYLRMEENA